MVSVIIPVYNVAPYLRQSLDSAIHQTYKGLEIIIIDDGSTDGSGDICEEYAARDERIRLIHQENKGLSAARNAGLNIMTGDVIAFLDSDDAYHPDYIRTMLETMHREKTDIVICGYSKQKTEGKLRFEEVGRTGPSLHKGKYNRIEALCALADMKLNHGVWNKLYKRGLWNNIRFPEGYVYEEVRTTYRILDSINSLAVIDQPLYLYRDRPESITNTRIQKNISDRLIARDEFESFIKANIPEMFTEEQFDKWRDSHFVLLITSYLQFCQGKNKDLLFCGELRTRIIELWRQEKGFRDIRLQVMFYVLYYWPWLLQIAYSVYRCVKDLKRSVSSKFFPKETTCRNPYTTPP